MKLSCTSCRQKKIKCDRESPCGPCLKSGSSCVPQVRAKTIRRSKKTDGPVLERLKQLESIVSRLEHGNAGELPVNVISGSASPDTRLSTVTTASDAPLFHVPAISTHEGGKLVKKNGQTSYVPMGFWMSLTNQISEQVAERLRDIDGSEYESEEDDEVSSVAETEHNNSENTAAFVLGFTSDSMTLRLLHPAAEHIKGIWGMFMENCKPVIKSPYIPYGNDMIRRAIEDLSSLSNIEEAWLFCMYYLVILSCKPQQCLKLFGYDRAVALERFRWASEQSLARAGFLLTQDLLLLEAFEFYCIALSRHIDNSTVRAMINLLVNVAHSMGLHRDGEQFGLPPFEVEWRRKLWWGVRTIDLRSSLDYDAQSMLVGRWSDTKFPTNLRDEDLWPGMTETPEPRLESTEISFTLLRWEVTDAMIAIAKLGQLPEQQRMNEIGPMNLKLKELERHIYSKYHLSTMKADDLLGNSVEWASVRLAKMLMARLWLIVNQPLISEAFKTHAEPELRTRAFEKANTALLVSDELERSIPYVKWGWLMKRMIDWQSVLIVLLELCDRTDGAQELWDVVDRAFVRWPGDGHNASPRLHKALQKLYLRAKEIHKAGNANPKSTVQPIESGHGFPPIEFTSQAPSGQRITDNLSPTPDSIPKASEITNWQESVLEDLPSLEEFDMLETTLNYDDLAIDWDSWMEDNMGET